MIAIEAALARLKAVKRLLAILCCLLFAPQLFAVQTLPQCATQPPFACACAHCNGMCGMKCCVAKSDSKSPVTPARIVSQNQLLVLATALTWSWLPIETSRPGLSSADSSPNSNAVPIFQRNCAILI
jgi:hypothetical protein